MGCSAPVETHNTLSNESPSHNVVILQEKVYESDKPAAELYEMYSSGGDGLNEKVALYAFKYFRPGISQDYVDNLKQILDIKGENLSKQNFYKIIRCMAK